MSGMDSLWKFVRRNADVVIDLVLVVDGGYLLFSEYPAWSRVLGAIFIVGGVWQPRWWRKRRV